MYSRSIHLLVFISILFFGISCGSSSEERTVISTKDIKVDEKIDTKKDRILNMKGEIIENNQVIMRFVAPLVYRTQLVDTSYIEFAKGVKGNFFDANTQKPSGNLEADYGIYYRHQKKMYLRKNVKLINSKGEVLRAEDLWWYQSTHRIHTDNRISFLQGGSKLYGRGLDADDNMNDYTVLQITGKIEDGSF